MYSSASASGKLAIAILVVIAFTTAPTLHGVIPHTHEEPIRTHTPIPDGVYTDSHGHAQNQSDRTENPIWTSLHSALHHEKKKVLDSLSVSVSQTAISVTASLLSSFVFYMLLTLLFFDTLRARYLHRGIAAYRRFR